MTVRPLHAFAAAFLLSCPLVHSQTLKQPLDQSLNQPLRGVQMASLDSGISSSVADNAAQPAAAQQAGSSATYSVPGAPSEEKLTREATGSLWRHPGIGVSAGVNGIGLDIAEPLGQHLNVRVGGEFFRFSSDFTEEGANVNAELAVGGGHVALDYYPWHNGFRISPQVRFAVQTEANVTVLVPAGSSVDIGGGTYVSSSTDPLHGKGYVNTRKAAPGISIGYGNLSPRHGAHWSFPVEIGFYYIGQPNLNVSFSGTACDPTQPAAIGCQDVTTDADFQADLKKFIARQNNNLSYASFFPIASIGVGYRF